MVEQGAFSSDLAGLNDYRFPSLYGSLRWTQDGFDVWNAGSRFYGGSAQFVYSIKPFGHDVKPTHRFDTAGTATYYCMLHPFMRGEVDVHNVLLAAPTEPGAPGRSYVVHGRSSASGGTDVGIEAAWGWLATACSVRRWEARARQGMPQ